MNDSDAALVAEEFGLGRLVSSRPLGKSSNETILLATDLGEYVAKRMSTVEWLTLYAAVEKELNLAGVKQAKLYTRSDGSLRSTSGYAVYEMLPGEPADHLPPSKIASTMDYLAWFNQALAGIQIPRWLSDADDPWTKAASVEFLVDDLPTELNSLGLPAEALHPARAGLDFLARHRQALVRDGRQLIHGDLGPGNLLFAGDQVVSAIDFTPQVGTELYSLCQLFFWHFLYLSPTGLDMGSIRLALEMYLPHKPRFDLSQEALHATMVLAAAFRLFGPAMATAGGLSAYSEDALVKRANLLSRVLSTPFSGAVPG